jgi:predicted phosphate transport protein (TIGR00153 family)
MLIFKKEKAVIELILQHIDTTRNCVQSTIDSLKAYVAGDLSEAKASISQVNQLESEADTLLREIRDLLYSGAYLPQIRGDIYGLMSTIDKVSNRSENCFDHFHYQAPVIPAEFETEMVAILDLTAECFLAFEKALKAYFGPKDKLEKVRKHSKRVSELESRIDEIERTMTTRIFKSSMDKGEMLHLRACLQKVASISDATENAADRLEWVSVKSII